MLVSIVPITEGNPANCITEGRLGGQVDRKVGKQRVLNSYFIMRSAAFDRKRTGIVEDVRRFLLVWDTVIRKVSPFKA